MDASKCCGYLGQACSSLVKLHLGAYKAGRQWGRGYLAIFFDLIFLHSFNSGRKALFCSDQACEQRVWMLVRVVDTLVKLVQAWSSSIWVHTWQSGSGDIWWCDIFPKYYFFLFFNSGRKALLCSDQACAERV